MTQYQTAHHIGFGGGTRHWLRNARAQSEHESAHSKSHSDRQRRTRSFGSRKTKDVSRRVSNRSFEKTRLLPHTKPSTLCPAQNVCRIRTWTVFLVCMSTIICEVYSRIVANYGCFLSEISVNGILQYCQRLTELHGRRQTKIWGRLRCGDSVIFF